MKYIMLETIDGQRVPFIFPEWMTHYDVSLYMRIMITTLHNKLSTAVTAGFITLGDITTHGKSESLELKSSPADADRILIGDSCAFMPDFMIAPLARKLKERKS
jgi:hypothetical protein